MWKSISNEAKDLVKKMLEKDPKLRICTKEALNHSWFTSQTTSANELSIAEENINKYCNEGYFNVESIKPEFSTIK